MKNKTILVTGANGLLGQKLINLLSEQPDVNLIATSRGNNRNPEGSYQYHPMDITIKEQVDRVISSTSPDVLIHTAAMTNVDECEQNREACDLINIKAVENLISACERQNSFLVHVSTDFIFDGTETLLTEDAEPAPVNYYGESKLASEKLIQNSDLRWAIARTVLVIGIAHDMSRSNIVLWVKKSLEEGKQINVVNDQYRTPTLAEDLALGCWLIADQEKQGVFNISGNDLLTPFEIARMTADTFSLDKSLIKETDSIAFTQPAKRPPKTGFNITKANHELGYKPHSFQESLEVLKKQVALNNQ